MYWHLLSFYAKSKKAKRLNEFLHYQCGLKVLNVFLKKKQTNKIRNGDLVFFRRFLHLRLIDSSPCFPK